MTAEIEIEGEHVVTELKDKALTGHHILSVDDNSDSLEITAYALELAGATVTSVSSGELALQTLDQLVPEVLVSDVGMPDIDGYMLIRKVRALPKGKGAQIKAIALTAYAQETDRQRLLAAGFQCHLTKPVDPDVLISTVSELINSDV